MPRSPLPQSVPAARHEREPQPSPKLPQQPLAGFCPQRSSESLPERPTQQYPQNRILPASPASCPSMARPKKQQTRPHQLRIQVVLCTECPSALPAVASQPSASRSQPRVQLVPAPPPAWPMDTHQRREAKPFFQEIDVLPPLPLPFLLCPCSVGEGEHWIRYPTSPMPKEVAHGQPSPPAPSFTRLEPPANRPCQRAPAAQPSEVGAMQRASSQPRVDLVPASVVNLLGLSRRPTDMPLLHEPQTLSPSSRSLGFRQPELRSPCGFPRFATLKTRSSRLAVCAFFTLGASHRGIGNLEPWKHPDHRRADVAVQQHPGLEPIAQHTDRALCFDVARARQL